VKRAGELDKPRPAPFSTLLKQSFDHKERTGAKEKNGCDLFHHYAESQDDSHHQGMHHAGAASPVEQHHEHQGREALNDFIYKSRTYGYGLDRARQCIKQGRVELAYV
jgi:hypothetical protein